MRQRPRQRVAATAREPARVAPAPNEQWRVDFVSDRLALGQRNRLLAVLDTSMREALAIAVDTSLPGARLAQVLDRLVAARGTPREIVLDNGPELTSRALDRWTDDRGARLHVIAAGNPVQNVFVASCNGRLREECLNEHWLFSLVDARWTSEAWRPDYHQARPHSALGYRTPDEFRCGLPKRTITPKEPVRLS